MNTNPESSKKFFIPIEHRRPANRWKASLSKSKWSDHMLHNQLMNSYFKVLVTRVKKLYSGLNEQAYNHDLRSKNPFNSTSMHVFLTQHLYLELECDYSEHRCYLLYDLERCPFEDKVKALLSEYPFSIASKHYKCEGGVAAYFNRVLAYQGDTHFCTL